MIAAGKLLTLLKFAAGGLISAPTALGVTAALHEWLGLQENSAAGLGLCAALAVNFVFLRHVVFAGSRMSLSRQIGMFLASSGLFRAAEYAGFLVVNRISGAHYLVALAAVLGASFLIKFFVYDKLVFARRPATDLSKEPR